MGEGGREEGRGCITYTIVQFRSIPQVIRQMLPLKVDICPIRHNRCEHRSTLRSWRREDMRQHHSDSRAVHTNSSRLTTTCTDTITSSSTHNTRRNLMCAGMPCQQQYRWVMSSQTKHTWSRTWEIHVDECTHVHVRTVHVHVSHDRVMLVTLAGARTWILMVMSTN